MADLADHPSSLALQQHLTHQFQAPTTQQWIEVQTAFKQLQKLLSLQPHNDPDSEVPGTPSSQIEGEILSAPLTRIGAPQLVVYAAGAHCLKLTPSNEYLECLAFGTISSKLFVEVFWEAIQNAQAMDPTCHVSVRSVKAGLRPAFVLRIESCTFEVTYCRCERLLRECDSIFEANPENCDDTWTLYRIRALADLNKLAFELENQPHFKLAYHYIRAWAISVGLYGESPSGLLSSSSILKLLRDSIVSADAQSQAALNSSFDAIIGQFFDFHSKASELQLESSPLDRRVDDLSKKIIQLKLNEMHSKVTEESQERNVDYYLDLLRNIQAEPLSSRISSPHIINTKVLYSGSSSSECFAWLEKLKSGLNDLKSALQPLNPTTAIHIWPSALVAHDAEDNAPVYEACFLLILFPFNSTTLNPNLDPNPEPITTTLNTWTQSQPTTPTSLLFTFYPSPSTEIDSLRPCTKTFSLPLAEPDFPLDFTTNTTISFDHPQKHQPAHTHKQKHKPPVPGKSTSRAHLVSSPSPHPNTQIINGSEINNLPSTSTSTISNPEKKPPLKTASQVLSRLRHDPRYEIEKYEIGYVDRHCREVKRKNAGRWVRDTMDGEWIPEHRILWFVELDGGEEGVGTEKGERYIWHRERRVDLMGGE